MALGHAHEILVIASLGPGLSLARVIAYSLPCCWTWRGWAISHSLRLRSRDQKNRWDTSISVGSEPSRGERSFSRRAADPALHGLRGSPSAASLGSSATRQRQVEVPAGPDRSGRECWFVTALGLTFWSFVLVHAGDGDLRHGAASSGSGRVKSASCSSGCASGRLAPTWAATMVGDRGRCGP